MKKLFLMMLTIVVVIGLAACSGTQTPSQPPSPGDQGYDEENVAGKAYNPSSDYYSKPSYNLTPDPLQLGYFPPEDGSNMTDWDLKAKDDLVLHTADKYVWNTGYYSVNEGEWKEFDLQGEEISNGWINGGNITRITFGYKDDVLTNESNLVDVIIYSCSLDGTDFDCHDNMWQLAGSEVIVNKEPSGPAYTCVNKKNGCWFEDSCYNKTSKRKAGNEIYECMGNNDWDLYVPEGPGDIPELSDPSSDNGSAYGANDSEEVCQVIQKGYEYNNESGSCVEKQVTACENPFDFETLDACQEEYGTAYGANESDSTNDTVNGTVETNLTDSDLKDISRDELELQKR